MTCEGAMDRRRAGFTSWHLVLREPLTAGLRNTGEVALGGIGPPWVGEPSSSARKMDCQAVLTPVLPELHCRMDTAMSPVANSHKPTCWKKCLLTVIQMLAA